MKLKRQFLFLSLIPIAISTSVAIEKLNVNKQNENTDFLIINHNLLNNTNKPLPKVVAPEIKEISQEYQFNYAKIEPGTNGQVDLLSEVNRNNNHNLLFPMAYEVNENGYSNKIIPNTIEFDLNTWKPLGMNDEVFLQNLRFNIFGGKMQINFNNQNLTQSTIITNNIIEKNYLDSTQDPFLQNKANWYNLFPKKQNKKEEKIVFNLLKSNNQYKKDYYAYIVLEIEWQQNLQIGLNRILIKPKLNYDLTIENKDKYNFVIPSQLMKISFFSHLLPYDEVLSISNDSYISDNKKVNVFQKENHEINSPIVNYLKIDTNQGANNLIISYDAQIPGKKLSPLNIDIANFYLDSDHNHKNTNFNVELSGLRLWDGKFIIKQQGNIINTINVLPEYKKDSSNAKNNDNKYQKYYQDYKINFDLNDNQFNNATNENYFIEKSYTIYSQDDILNLNNFDSNQNEKALLELRIKIHPVFDEGKRIPFQYQIKEIGVYANPGISKQGGKIDIEAKLYSSQLIIKTKPKDFSFSKIQADIIEYQKVHFKTTSKQHNHYSSNVYDDSYFLDEYNKKVKTNYQYSFEEANERFKKLTNLSNFKTLSANQGLNALNEPFIQTLYTGLASDFRRQGLMKLKYSPIKENKYFKYIEFILRTKYSDSNNSIELDQNEIINVSINYDKLNEQIKKVKDISTLVNNLNNLSIGQKISLLNVENIDSNEALINIFSSINFNIEDLKSINVVINISDKFRFLHNERLTNNLTIISEQLKIESFNKDKVVLSIKEDLVRQKAATVKDYEEFKTKFEKEIYNLIDINNINVIDKIYFVDTPGFNHRITIRVSLMDGFIFTDNSNIKDVSVGNINWLNQSNKAQKIDVKINFNELNKILINYENVEQLIEKNPSPSLESVKGIFVFGPKESLPNNEYDTITTINDLYSIRFEKVASSRRKVKIILQAKEWRYFDFPGSTSKDDQREFIISNIIWKGENPSSLIGVDVNIDMPLLYNLLVNYNKKNPTKTLSDFVKDYYSSFINYGKNEASIIKLDPYQILALDLPEVIAQKDGIKILLNLNEGYYVNQTNNFEHDRFISTFETFISIDQIKEFHQQIIKPNPDNEIKIDLNYEKISQDALKEKNINSFIRNQLSSEYEISKYFRFSNPSDITKIKSYKLEKISSNSLKIITTLFSDYFYSDENYEIKKKEFLINNLIFLNEEKNLQPVSITIDQHQLLLEAKKYTSRDQLIQAYENKNDYDSFKSFVLIDSKWIDAINLIKMEQGKNLKAITIIIELKAGYYFNGKPFSQSKLKFNIDNLLFKNDPKPEEIFKAIKVEFDGNKFLEKAKEFNNFSDFRKFLYEDGQNWGQFITFNFKEGINKISLEKISDNRVYIELIAKEDFYFESQHYTINKLQIIVGNLYFKNSEINLKEIDLKINLKVFYNSIKEYKNKTLEEFIEDNKKNFLNFSYPLNGIYYTNSRDVTNFKTLFVESLPNNQFKVLIELNDGYFFNKFNKAEVQFKKTYNKEEIVQLAKNGLKQIEQEEFNKKLKIGLGISIPFALLFIAIFVGIIMDKRKRKKIREG